MVDNSYVILTQYKETIGFDKNGMAIGGTKVIDRQNRTNNIQILYVYDKKLIEKELPDEFDITKPMIVTRIFPNNMVEPSNKDTVAVYPLDDYINYYNIELKVNQLSNPKKKN